MGQNANGLTKPACSCLPTSPSTCLTGLYELSCRVTDHFAAGMREQYHVDLCTHHNITRTESSRIVQYFISAEEVEWDYSEERVWELEKHQATLEDRCASGTLALLWVPRLATGSKLVSCPPVQAVFSWRKGQIELAHATRRQCTGSTRMTLSKSRRNGSPVRNTWEFWVNPPFFNLIL